MQKTCRRCDAAFDITDAALAFYDAVSPVIAGKKHALPSPTLCPACRYQGRLTWRNERSLHKRVCGATGKPIVSIFAPEKTWPPVYEQAYWWSDKWDPKSHGRAMDFSRPFFEQWAELFRAVPQIAMNNQQSENCEYTNQSQRNKDCYMVFCSNGTRDSYYGMWYQKCVNVLDSAYLEKGELCHEVVNGHNCYACAYSQNLENCSEVLFSKNCIGCKYCYGCINLRNKEYAFFNEQLTKDEYESRVAAIKPGSHTGVVSSHERAQSFFRDFPHKYYTGAVIHDSSGDYLMNVKDVRACFNCRNAEAMEHCQDVWRSHHCRDLTETVENDFCYSLEGCATGSNSLFCKKFCDLSNSLYCSHCHFSKDLFGCVCLRQARHCILNVQYTKEQYEELAPRIIAHMKTTGEWGEHFPPQFSPFGYNETVAQEYFPLTREQGLAQDFRWRDETDPPPSVPAVDATALPDSIDEADDRILDVAIRCAATGRLFRIIKQELQLLRQMHVPLPRLHPDERYRRRMSLRNPRRLWERECMKCAKPVRTSFPPDGAGIVYCEECYLQATA